MLSNGSLYSKTPSLKKWLPKFNVPAVPLLLLNLNPARAVHSLRNTNIHTV